MSTSKVSEGRDKNFLYYGVDKRQNTQSFFTPVARVKSKKERRAEKKKKKFTIFTFFPLCCLYTPPPTKRERRARIEQFKKQASHR